jgi:type I restriction enzyme M protein
VSIDRPLRLAAQFTAEKLAQVRFIPALREVMEWAYGKWGEGIYQDLKSHQAAIEAHLEQEEIELDKKNREKLFNLKTWTAQRDLLVMGESLLKLVGGDLWLDYNLFAARVDEAIKQLGCKLSASEKKQLLSAVSWRDETAARVVKKVHKFKSEALAELLIELDTSGENLQDFGYWAGAKAGEYVEYESDSELRDNENVPLNYAVNGESGTSAIHRYFLAEVRPHVEDAWIEIDKTQIGYEISFNKYFYQHQPLRSLAEVTAEILQLERETEGLLKKLVSFGEMG